MSSQSCTYTRTHGDLIRIHKYKTIYNNSTHALIASVQQITVLHMHVGFVRNVAHVRFFSSRACEFLNQETHQSGKFTPRENSPLYGILAIGVRPLCS